RKQPGEAIQRAHFVWGELQRTVKFRLGFVRLPVLHQSMGESDMGGGIIWLQTLGRFEVCDRLSRPAALEEKRAKIQARIEVLRSQGKGAFVFGFGLVELPELTQSAGVIVM